MESLANPSHAPGRGPTPIPHYCPRMTCLQLAWSPRSFLTTLLASFSWSLLALQKPTYALASLEPSFYTQISYPTPSPCRSPSLLSTHLVNRTPQTSQAKGFSPVWVLMWRGSLPAPWIILWQTGHSWGIWERRLRTSLSWPSRPGAKAS